MNDTDFKHWVASSAARFPESYIQKRLKSEKRKASSILAKEKKGIRQLVEPKIILNAALKLSGLRKKGQLNALDIRLVENQLPMSNLPEAFRGYKILQLSDLHFNRHEGVLERLTELIEHADYDLCVLTGDYRYRSFGLSDVAIDGLCELTNFIKTNIVSILGNHDSVTSVPAMEALGMTVLLNEYKEIRCNESRLIIAGVDDPSYYRSDDIELAIRDISEFKETASILLAHSPDIFEKAAGANFNAYLCGHTHGGQVCLSAGKALYRNYRSPDWTLAGSWEYDSMSGYTSVGVGTSVVNVRFNCAPEITIHELIPG